MMTQKKILAAVTIVMTGFFMLSFLSCVEEKSSISESINKLKNKNLPPYAASKLDECLHDIETLSNDTIETLSEDASLHELTRLINTTRTSYHALNHHVFGWNTTMEHLYLSNREAVKRGVEVTRTIILGDDILSNPDLLQNALVIMEIQQKDGIKVFYGLQRELEKEPGYARYLLLDVGLSDGIVYATVKAVSIKGPQPAQISFAWKPETVQNNPFAYLRKSPQIYPFNDEARQRLLALTVKK